MRLSFFVLILSFISELAFAQDSFSEYQKRVKTRNKSGFNTLPPPPKKNAVVSNASLFATKKCEFEFMTYKRQVEDQLKSCAAMQVQFENFQDKFQAFNEHAERLKSFAGLSKKFSIEKLVNAFTHPDSVGAVEAMLENGSMRQFSLGQLIAFLLFLLLRTWRATRAKSILGRLWVSLYCFTFYISLILVAVPLTVFGRPYIALVNSVYRQLLG